MGKKGGKTKHVKANLETKMDNERGEPKSPTDSDKDKVVAMKDFFQLERECVQHFFLHYLLALCLCNSYTRCHLK